MESWPAGCWACSQISENAAWLGGLEPCLGRGQGSDKHVSAAGGNEDAPVDAVPVAMESVHRQSLPQRFGRVHKFRQRGDLGVLSCGR